MNLFDRDFSTLTPEEEAEWRALEPVEVIHEFGNLKVRKPLFHLYPRAVRHYLSLFPNHYLDPVELADAPLLRENLAAFRILLDAPTVSERAILNFIKEKRAHFIVGSLLDRFPFGHHGAYLFPEFPLGNSYRADYLLVGENSDGWHLVFVEFEAPIGHITLKSGEIGNTFRKGLSQINDWSAWLEAHYSNLREVFGHYRNRTKDLPEEFCLLDRSRIHYVVVAGRRKDFNEKTYRCRRTTMPPTQILHYDNIADAAEKVIGRCTY